MVGIRMIWMIHDDSLCRVGMSRVSTWWSQEVLQLHFSILDHSGFPAPILSNTIIMIPAGAGAFPRWWLGWQGKHHLWVLLLLCVAFPSVTCCQATGCRGSYGTGFSGIHRDTPKRQFQYKGIAALKVLVILIWWWIRFVKTFMLCCEFAKITCCFS